MNVKYSERFSNIEQKLRDMPKRTQRSLKSVYRKNANEFIKVFKDGVRSETFNLKKLKVGTIQRKASAGFPQPETPLYGLGDMMKDRSYINMFRIREVINGYLVQPSIAKHWSGKISLRNLFLVHEFGATIKRGKSLVRIPARPAVKKAYTRFLRSDFAKQSKQRVTELLFTYLKRHK
jgi:hypothetical protein